MVTAIPLIALIVCALIPVRMQSWRRGVGIALSSAKLLLAFVLLAVLNDSTGFDLVERYAWVPSIGAGYVLSVDGISALLVLASALALLLGLIAMPGSRDGGGESKILAIMFLDFAATGALLATDAMLFFAFIELSVIALAVISESKRPSLRFVVLMMSALGALLVAVAYCGTKAGSYDIVSIYACRFGGVEQLLVLSLLVFSFSVISGIFPFGGWLKDALLNSKGPVALIIVASFLKLGIYGMARFALPVFPVAVTHLSEPMIIFFTASGFLGALFSVAQKDARALGAALAGSMSALCAAGVFWTNPFSAVGSFTFLSAVGISVGTLSMTIAALGRTAGSFEIDALRRLAVFSTAGSAAFALIVTCASAVVGTAVYAAVYVMFLGAFQQNSSLAFSGMLAAFAAAMPPVYLAIKLLSGKEPAEIHTALLARERIAIAMALLTLFFAGIFPSALMSKLWNSAMAFAELSTRTRSIEIVPSGEKR